MKKQIYKQEKCMKKVNRTVEHIEAVHGSTLGKAFQRNGILAET